jgi:hypothetical protein
MVLPAAGASPFRVPFALDEREQDKELLEREHVPFPFHMTDGTVSFTLRSAAYCSPAL